MPEDNNIDSSFADILNTPAVDIVPAPLLPEGHWVLELVGYKLGIQDNENKTKYVQWEFAPQEPCMDVAMPEDEEIDLTQKKLFKKFWLTDNPATTVRYKKFLINSGVDTEDGSSLKECTELGKQHQIIAYISIKDARSGKEEDRYNEVGEGFLHMDEAELING